MDHDSSPRWTHHRFMREGLRFDVVMLGASPWSNIALKSSSFLVGEVPKNIAREDMDPHPHRNGSGWEFVRRGLSMIDKTHYRETPSFGDASTQGTNTHFR